MAVREDAAGPDSKNPGEKPGAWGVRQHNAAETAPPGRAPAAGAGGAGADSLDQNVRSTRTRETQLSS